MLPVANPLYRRLLLVALILGVAGGFIGLVYSAFTGFGNDLFFGDPTSEPWSGQWWWIPLVSGGAVLVTALRKLWSVPEHVSGAIAYVRAGWVDPSSVLSLFAISAISLFTGASLGPSFGIIVAAGGLGSWIISRLSTSDTDAQHAYTLTGMAGGLGAALSGPLLAAVMTGELSSTSKKRYVAAFIPQLLAATIGYVIFFGITGKVMLDTFNIPGYEYENAHLLYGGLLGLFSVVVLLAQALIRNFVVWLAPFVKNPYARAAAGGAIVGLIAFALPLTVNGGSSQLSYETGNIATLSIGLLLAVLVGKMAAFTLSQEAGFLGGLVFPILFVGGTAGILVHLVFPWIPAPLAVAGMVAAVPGAVLGSPVSFILLGAFTVGLGLEGIVPVGIAVINSHLAVWGLQVFKATRENV